MKKFLSGVLIGLLSGFILTTATIGYAERPINLFVNNREIISDVPPLKVDGRVMVPVRFVAETLGASVSWDENTYSVFINNPQQNSLPYSVPYNNEKTDYTKKEVELLELIKKNMDDCNKIVIMGFVGSTYEIEKIHNEIEKAMSDLRSYPSDYQHHYSALLDLFTAYSEYKNLILSKNRYAYQLQANIILDKYNIAISKLRITLPLN